jgi:hypothetical protein
LDKIELKEAWIREAMARLEAEKARKGVPPGGNSAANDFFERESELKEDILLLLLIWHMIQFY